MPGGQPEGLINGEIAGDNSLHEEDSRLSSSAGNEVEGSSGSGHSEAGEALPARASLEETIRAARSYAEAARAPNIIRAYASDLEDFRTYCRVKLGGESSLPAHPEVVALYVTRVAPYKH